MMFIGDKEKIIAGFRSENHESFIRRISEMTGVIINKKAVPQMRQPF